VRSISSSSSPKATHLSRQHLGAPRQPEKHTNTLFARLLVV
jgi:hypothetical protein